MGSRFSTSTSTRITSLVRLAMRDALLASSSLPCVNVFASTSSLLWVVDSEMLQLDLIALHEADEYGHDLC
ncbi:unnamed protein product [Peniophora sp. CBMAI 1063]|nr:unnamed protein product [Peniophora sp. CBMAI 1063]